MVPHASHVSTATSLSPSSPVHGVISRAGCESSHPPVPDSMKAICRDGSCHQRFQQAADENCSQVLGRGEKRKMIGRGEERRKKEEEEEKRRENRRGNKRKRRGEEKRKRRGDSLITIFDVANFKHSHTFG